jgi:hypothetical protein
MAYYRMFGELIYCIDLGMKIKYSKAICDACRKCNYGK